MKNAIVIVYAGQTWRLTAIRAGALLYTDLLAPAYYETSYADSQQQAGEIARRLVTQLGVLVQDPGVLAAKMSAPAPIIDPEVFTVLQDRRIAIAFTLLSPRRHGKSRPEHRLRRSLFVSPSARRSCWVVSGNTSETTSMTTGGFHPSNTTEVMKAMLRLVPAHNRLSEVMFSHVDQYYSHCFERADLSTATATVLSRRNGTLAWYCGLPLASRALYDAAMRDPARKKLVADKDKPQRQATKARGMQQVEEAIEKARKKAAMRDADYIQPPPCTRPWPTCTKRWRPCRTKPKNKLHSRAVEDAQDAVDASSPNRQTGG